MFPRHLTTAGAQIRKIWLRLQGTIYEFISIQRYLMYGCCCCCCCCCVLSRGTWHYLNFDSPTNALSGSQVLGLLHTHIVLRRYFGLRPSHFTRGLWMSVVYAYVRSTSLRGGVAIFKVNYQGPVKRPRNTIPVSR